MSEKLLITQALDERDFLVKKIFDKIASAVFLDLKRNNEDTTLQSRQDMDTFAKNAESSLQQINDLIARYDRINAGIVASNAATTIKTSFGEFTVAAAISLKNRLAENVSTIRYSDIPCFEAKLASKMEADLKEISDKAASMNLRVQSTAENMRLSILGRDAKQKEDKPLAVVDAYVAENAAAVVDPLLIGQKIKEIRDRNAALLKELETQIKVSNATTYIEV